MNASSKLLRLVRPGTLAVVVGAVLLAACGGGNDDQPADPTASVPASASQNPAGFIAYLQALIAAPADTLEPVDTTALVAPTDDTGEPVALN